MATKKKIIWTIIFIVITPIIIFYICLSIWGLGMQSPPNKETEKEIQFCRDFRKKHPRLELSYIYGGNIWFVIISHESKNKLDSLYYKKLNKKDLADSIAKTYSVLPHKYEVDSLFIEFNIRYRDTIQPTILERRDVEFHYKGSK